MAGRFPQYVTDYLDKQHGYAMPATPHVALTALIDHIFELALEAYRLRERVPQLITHERQELDWLEKSLSSTPRSGRPADLYEAVRGSLAPSDAWVMARRLNELERRINELCRATEDTTSALRP